MSYTDLTTNIKNMKRSEFEEFALTKEDTVDRFAILINRRKWFFRWDYLKEVIVRNNVKFENLVIILDVFNGYCINMGKETFIDFICKKANLGYTVLQIIQFLNDEFQPTLKLKMGAKQPFTDEEKKISDLLVEAHNRFVSLEETHDHDKSEWVLSIHRLQDILGSRVLRRDYPDTFRSK